MSDRPNRLLQLGPIEAPQAQQNVLAPQPTWADAYDYNARAYTDWVARERAKGVELGTINPETGWPTRAGYLDAVQQYSNALLMGTSTPAAKMPVLYHGTNEGSLSMHGREMSLTPDRTQARGYSNNYHKTDEAGDYLDEPLRPVVHQIDATPGRVLDVNAEIRRYESGKAGTNADAFIATLAEDARKKGYRYLQFDHPNMPMPGADPGGTHQVILSLHPNDDLGYSLKIMEAEEVKRRMLQAK